MQTALIVLVTFIALSFAGVIFYLYQKLQKQQTNKNTLDDAQNQLFMMLQRQIQDLSRTMDQKMTDTHNTLQSQFSLNTRIIQDISGQSTKMISEITEKLTSLDKTNQQVVGF